MPPLILTLAFDDESFQKLDALRQRHFPSRSYALPAHLTLFHALPGENEGAIRQLLREKEVATAPFGLRFRGLRFLGRGVAIDVESPPLLKMRSELAREWRENLSPQDAQGYKHPHVTIQNKVAPPTARTLFDSLQKGWQPWDGRGEALLLWRYLGGPWELVERFEFKS